MHLFIFKVLFLLFFTCIIIGQGNVTVYVGQRFGKDALHLMDMKCIIMQQVQNRIE